jgi:hypothetical protein
MEKAQGKDKEADVMHTSGGEMPDADAEDAKIKSVKESEEEAEEAFKSEEEPKKDAA